MASRSSKGNHDPEQQDVGVTRITVAGFKSIRKKQSIDVAPLTILAGANSSGKSSMMQPLLLMKQTLEERFGDRALELDGSHIHFGEGPQILWRGDIDATTGEFRAGLLRAIREHGSVSAAASSLGLPYRTAWKKLDEMQAAAGAELIATASGGRGGRRTSACAARASRAGRRRRRRRPDGVGSSAHGPPSVQDPARSHPRRTR